MNKILNKRVINVEKVKELDGELNHVRITFEDGETVETAAKHIFRSGDDV